MWVSWDGDDIVKLVFFGVWVIFVVGCNEKDLNE